MAYFAFALMFLGGLAAAVWLVVTGHPWFALLVLLLIWCLELKSDTKSTDSEDEP